MDEEKEICRTVRELLGPVKSPIARYQRMVEFEMAPYERRIKARPFERFTAGQLTPRKPTDS